MYMYMYMYMCMYILLYILYGYCSNTTFYCTYYQPTEDQVVSMYNVSSHSETCAILVVFGAEMFYFNAELVPCSGSNSSAASHLPRSEHPHSE